MIKTFNLLDLEQGAKIVQLPFVTSPAKSAQLARELEQVKRDYHLSALRDGRQTDLARPIAQMMPNYLRKHAPTLCQKIAEVESWLEANYPELFVRTVKYDEARLSSTAAGNKDETNWHFDAGKSSMHAWPAAIWQFYLNIASNPRYFRIHPTPLPAMIRSLAEMEKKGTGEIANRKANDVLAQYRLAFPDVITEEKVIPSGAMVMFDGRRFAHDAGKWSLGSKQDNGEPDMVLALDLKSDIMDQTICRPNLPFLIDCAQ